MKLIPSIMISACLPLLIACEKEIELDYDDADARLVVEGVVTQGSGPHEVRLSRSVGYTQRNTFPSVDNATVLIRDDQGVEEILNHVGGGRYQTNGELVGVPGRTYTLSISVDGTVISGQSRMPTLVEIDTVEVSNFTAFGGEDIIILPRYTDPAGVANYYRLRGYTNGDAWSAIFARDDKVSDGQVNGQPIFTNEDPLEPGDTVRVDLFGIDEAVHLYWFTLEQNTGGGPNGSAAPADPTSNLSGKVLGYFSAQTLSTRSVIIP